VGQFAKAQRARIVSAITRTRPAKAAVPDGRVADGHSHFSVDRSGEFERLCEESPEAMKGALARHDVILRDAVEGHGVRS
jgi:hypothetical protein